MYNVEVEIMALRLQREHDLKKHMEQGRTLRELSKQSIRAERPGGTIAPFCRRHIAGVLQQGRWRWAASRREREIHLSAAAD